jgi:hypothetical protein
LIDNKSSNRRRQPKIGTALTAEWMAITWMSQCIERTNKALECKQRHPRTMNHQRGGDLYFKSGKDTCISITMHCFYHCQIGDTYHFSGSVFSNPTSFWVRLWALTSQVVCFLTLPHSECAFEPPSLR